MSGVNIYTISLEHSITRRSVCHDVDCFDMFHAVQLSIWH